MNTQLGVNSKSHLPSSAVTDRQRSAKRLDNMSRTYARVSPLGVHDAIPFARHSHERLLARRLKDFTHYAMLLTAVKWLGKDHRHFFIISSFTDRVTRDSPRKRRLSRSLSRLYLRYEFDVRWISSLGATDGGAASQFDPRHRQNRPAMS